MSEAEILEELRSYVVDRLLEGAEVGLTETTPLLELGILNSMEVVRLITRVETLYRINVPPDQVLAENLKDLRSITTLIAGLIRSAPAAASRA
jgi:acyl carrier protein